MDNERKGIRAIIVTLGLLAALVVVQVSLAGPAQARCDGVNDQVTSTMNINTGVVSVTETPIIGTCNDNYLYQGRFRSHHAGWRASVWIERNGWIAFYGGYNILWNNYSFSDANTPVEGAAAIHLCLDNGVTWYCGWGNNVNVGAAVNHSFTGLNHGF